MVTLDAPSVAVIVTSWLCAGPSFVANDQSHVPSAFFTTEPTDAVRFGFVPPQRPVLVAVWPSFRTISAPERAVVVRMPNVKPCHASGVGTVQENVGKVPMNRMVP